MDFQVDICCLCLNTSVEKLHPLNSSVLSEISYYDKINSSLSKLISNNEYAKDYVLCMKCCSIIDYVYEFNISCTRNLDILTRYRAALSSPSNTQCNRVVRLSDFTINKESIKLGSVITDVTDMTVNNTVPTSETVITQDGYEQVGNLEVDIKEECIEDQSVVEERLGDTYMKVEEVNIKMEVPDEETYAKPCDEIDATVDSVADCECESTPPELREATGIAEGIPEKSRARYENTYEMYNKWCLTKGVEHVTETVLLTYFSELAEQNKPSTLWARYSMLRAVLNIRHNVDISKYATVRAYLKGQNVGYKAKKSSVLSEGDIEKFLNNAPIEYLPQKVALIIGVSGACRCDELLNMKISDVDILENRIIIVIPVRTTYTRTFVITRPEWVTIVKQYYNLRNKVEAERFFLQMRFGKVTGQNFGHNAIGNFPKKIATYLKLDNINGFTGHCFRRTSKTLLANPGEAIQQLKRLGAVPHGYEAPL